MSLRKHAYSNILKISPPKPQSFQIKKLWYFHISAQNIDCGYSLEPPRQGGSNEYPQSMFWADTSKIMCTPVNLSFTIQKWGLRGSKLYMYVFVMFIKHYNLKNLKWLSILVFSSKYLCFCSQTAIWYRVISSYCNMTVPFANATTPGKR